MPQIARQRALHRHVAVGTDGRAAREDEAGAGEAFAGLERQVQTPERQRPVWHVERQRAVDDAQAAELGLAVKTVANALEQQGAANGYQRVYGELYRKFAITSYKNLPRRRYQEALEWLRGWYQELEGESSQ